jgi:hypothetical protein
MTTKYEQIKNIHELAVEANDENELHKILPLLESWEIKQRGDDGKLLWTTLSVPTSVGGTIAIGYRYIKRDKTLTEDIFEISESNPNEVGRYYRGKYEDLRPEYERTHKEQNVGARSFTRVNTCSLYLGS